MDTVYKSKFLKADNRIARGTPGVQTLTTQRDKPVSVNDVTLAADATTNIVLPANALNFIIPIAGGVITKTDNYEINLAAEEVYCSLDHAENTITISNPFRVAAVNFLHVIIHEEAHEQKTPISCVEGLSIHKKNSLTRGGGRADRLNVGVYDSRIKDHLVLDGNNNAAFSYVINGSFDFEERLMEYRDGLFQWDVRELEFEALSETAIIMIIKCSL